MNSLRRSLLASILALVLMPLAGCATGGGPDWEGPDPFESANRGVFAFNEGLDRYLLDPVATAWAFVLPDFALTGLANFFDHLNMPIVLANDLLQGKPVAAVEDVARIAHNTVFGFAGFYDFATRVGIPENDEDFGQCSKTLSISTLSALMSCGPSSILGRSLSRSRSSSVAMATRSFSSPTAPASVGSWNTCIIVLRTYLPARVVDGPGAATMASKMGATRRARMPQVRPSEA